MPVAPNALCDLRRWLDRARFEAVDVTPIRAAGPGNSLVQARRATE